MRTLLTVERAAVRGAAVPSHVYQLHGNGETRTLTVPDRRQLAVPANLEVRSASDASPQIFGSAFVYGTRSLDLGGYSEVIARGAVRKVLRRDPDVISLYNHNTDIFLGRTRNGTLKLTDTARALNYVAKPPDTSQAADVLTLIREGAVTGSSFAFTIANDRWEIEDDGTLVRTVLEMGDLYEVGPVVMPAYPSSTTGTRSHAERRRALLTRARAAIKLSTS